ncbi:MAG: UDP-N-acetylmuramate--L-alanine ligase [Gemmatimonadetes bacterium]|nr:UDP-N-acetylmuramate--L-alanine ligase [Gemmatimonadota bacterium]
MRATVDLRALAKHRPVHFMGVGGAGMCALAELVLKTGGRVSGCDQKESAAIADLRKLGAGVRVGHDAAHVAGATALVITSAVPADHPEVIAAQRAGIPVLKRAEALGAWVASGKVVAVAGTHGKTTTTAMTTEVLARGGLNPTGIVGGRVAAWDGNLRFGAPDLYVVEADEYDRSFHQLTPDIAIVTNVEADHLDVYDEYAGVRAGFATFLDKVRPGGRVIACADDHGASSLLARVASKAYTYGTSAGAMLRAVDVVVGQGATKATVIEDCARVGTLTLRKGGRHNLLNALGAAAAARTLGVEWIAIREALADFAGVSRRFERLGEVGEVVVVDDYAHHPTEISATLAAARASFPNSRLVVAFQPHLYSRTRDFAAEFGRALAAADVLWVTDVFPAREAPIPGITGETIVRAARQAGAEDVRSHAALATLPDVLADKLRAGDVLLTMGAGSIESVGRDVLARLEEVVHA